MAKFYDELTPALIEFVRAQPMYFVASAPAEGRVNLSPKGIDSLRVIDAKTFVYLDLTGSGNETAAHLRENGRVTVMLCAFEGKPKILRLYGRGRTIGRSDSQWEALRDLFPHHPGLRQFIWIDVESLQTSCGFGVPELQFIRQRTVFDEWTEKKGPAGIRAYWEKHNRRSIDGLPTGIEGQLGDSIDGRNQ